LLSDKKKKKLSLGLA